MQIASLIFFLFFQKMRFDISCKLSPQDEMPNPIFYMN